MRHRTARLFGLGTGAKAAVTAAALAGAVALAGMAGAAPDRTRTEAKAVAVRITVPGAAPVAGGEVVGPPNASTEVSGFSHPDDGSIVRIGSASSSVTAQPGVSASARANVNLLAVTLFGGEVTVGSLTTVATAAAGAVTATSDVSPSQVQGLVVLGQPVTLTADSQLPLADWGTLELLSGTSTQDTSGKKRRSAQATIVGLKITLLLDHGGLVAGSEIELGLVSASAVTSPASAAAPLPSPKPAGTTVRGARKPRSVVEPGKSIPGAPPELVKPLPPAVRATLTSAGYVFPVNGPATFGDSFGAYRADVAGKWHHGEDVFAPRGTPLLAVTNGTVFSVGWNEIGGWRLWLRDDAGNEFYYAHLSAYSPLAVDGKRVRAGDVIGFLGESGDADGGLPHLHFEIHPFSLLGLGYDGVVAPYPFLVAWRKAVDVPFSEGRSYVPDANGLPRAAAPPPGAILLRADDVSQASGLVPGALARALRAGGNGPTPVPSATPVTRRR